MTYFTPTPDANGDYAPSIQSAIDTASSASSGTLELSPGVFTCKTALSVNTKGLRIKGQSKNSTLLLAGVADVDILTISGTGNGLEHIGIADPFFGSTNKILTLNDAVETKVDNVRLSGGNSALKVVGNSGDNAFTQSIITNAYGNTIYITGNGTYFHKCKIDKAWPVQTPIASNVKNNWAASTAYSVGDIAITQGFYVQCKTAGTSSSTAPTLDVWGADIADGTAVWRLACGSNSAAVLLDTGAVYNTLTGCDITGAYRNGLRLSNSLSGYGPQKTIVERTEIGATLIHAIDLQSGAGVLLHNTTLSNGVYGTSVGVYVESGFSGDVVMDQCLGYGFNNGAVLAGGTNTLIQGSEIFGCANAAVRVTPGVSKFAISNNAIGSSTSWGANGTAVQIANGASDFYNVTNNIVVGATAGVSDGGSGVNKSISGNV